MINCRGATTLPPRVPTSSMQRQSSGGQRGESDLLFRSVDNLNLKALAQPPRSARVGSTYSASSSRTASGAGAAGASAAPGSATKSTVRWHLALG